MQQVYTSSLFNKSFQTNFVMVGSYAHLVMVNSLWTQSHIEKLWGIPKSIKRVYPPCDTSGLQALPLERSVETPKIISVAQFRPEKAHSLQLEAFSVAIKKLDEHSRRPKLQFVGSCRNKSDKERLKNLKDKAVQLNIQDDVEFHKNVMYWDLVSLLGGGQQTGFLAQNVEEYVDAVLKIMKMPESERLKIATATRRRATRFSEQRFYNDLKAAIRPIICGSS
ncbi:hypothetical protein ES332_D08G149100v1 [Gossypium tomentosum]|uniref:Glycosyl transferase family 1 domain-containing protein n=1 Tax=Gossypium tomentosum TaxID=34277 RepID=A0A5D2JU60_GOSTO|nr:hypothetical protein ES332_D08G149100v1 [Gossypium tomentosum]